MNPLNQTIDNAAATIIKPLEISTGFQKLDKITRGLRRCELTIIAARPSMGKSSLMLDLAKHTSKTVETAIFSMEMNQGQLIDRMFVSEQGVSLYDLQNGKVGVKDETIQSLKSRRLSIDDTSGITTRYIWDTLQASSFDVVFVDYINLFRKSNRVTARHEEIGEVVQNLRDIARKKNIAMVGVCQLNRELEHRDNHRPRLSDLRDSGEIEQIADNIILLHRPSYYVLFEESKVDTPDDWEAHFIVAKNRNGPLGVVDAVWRPPLMSFTEANFKEEQF
jgi:replicative DNA helicase